MNSKLLIYQVFVRNYSNEGTFYEVEKDLTRIAALGTDILYLMPIHPIGIDQRKGSYGSPYAIKDYFAITPDYGTLDDFKSLVRATHDLGMKTIIDIVFHHTSPDNDLINTHPEYYFYRDGKRGNRVGDWSDIVDLDTDRQDTQEYLLSVLRYWVEQGVDGFRFDVASMISFSFFEKARKAFGPDVIFFAESIDYDFAKYLATTSRPSTPDYQMVPVFDYLYNYHCFREFQRSVANPGYLQSLCDAINLDDTYDPPITRVNCLENHDNQRFTSYPLSLEDQKRYIDLFFALKGHVFLYMGQEYGANKDVPLFEKDPVDFSHPNPELTEYYKYKLSALKSMPEVVHQHLSLLEDGRFLLEQETIDQGTIKTVI